VSRDRDEAEDARTDGLANALTQTMERNDRFQLRNFLLTRTGLFNRTGPVVSRIEADRRAVFMACEKTSALAPPSQERRCEATPKARSG
jgi:hypothetical protein